jgi:hypothetical protein
MQPRARKIFATSFALLALTAIASTQLMAIVKAVGMAAAVNTFGKDINKALNKLQDHKDTPALSSKMVIIFTAGVKTPTQIGMAQVMGPKAKLDQVGAVAQLEQNLFGVKIRALIPVKSEKVTDIRKIEGTSVTGIVDIKL